jgi:carbon monoxide dehydrogenase subunit G
VNGEKILIPGIHRIYKRPSVMSKIESRTGKIAEKDTVIYNFLSDFNNYRQLIPAERIKYWEATADSCSFTVDGMGHAGLKIVEREPDKMIKISSDEKTMFQFLMWIQLKAMAEEDTRVKITIEVNLNPFMLSMVNKPLKEFTDMLVEQLEKIPFRDLH